MALKVTPLRREFIVDGRKIADPKPEASIDEVRVFLSETYPELNNSGNYDQEIHGSVRRITFHTAVGTKG